MRSKIFVILPIMKNLKIGRINEVAKSKKFGTLKQSM